ncbi:MAG: efflux RND transporter periplasmic adaptor subunit, partial [Gaiellaceae bacterium]
SAVTGSGSAARVTVMRNGQETAVPVATGLKGDSTTEIVSGLKAGDQVVLPTATLASGSGLSTGTSTTGNRNFGGGFPGLGG